LAGQLISSNVAHVAVVVLLARTEPFATVLQKRHLPRLGKIAPRFCDALAYFDFSQLLIIWSGNQPGRNQLLSHAAVRRLGRRRGNRAGVPFFVPFSCSFRRM